MSEQQNLLVYLVIAIDDDDEHHVFSYFDEAEADAKMEELMEARVKPMSITRLVKEILPKGPAKVYYQTTVNLAYGGAQ